MLPFIFTFDDMGNEGNDEWFVEFYKTHYLLIQKAAKENSEDASRNDDIIFEACYKLYRHANILKVMLPPMKKSYILKTVKHVAFDSNKRAKLISQMLERMYIAQESLREETNPEIIVERKERMEFVIQALEKLPTKERSALCMKAYYNFSNREIAEQLELSENSIPKYISRAQEKMRAMLKAYDSDGGDGGR